MKYTTLILTVLIFLQFSCKKGTETNSDDSRSKIINASEINKSIKNGENIILRDAAILGSIDFTNSKDINYVNADLIKHTVHSSLTFYDCTFKGKVTSCKNEKNISIISAFNKSICFVNCTFQDTVDFSNSDFKDVITFSNAVFQNFVSFKSAFFSTKGVDFSKSHFIKYAKFNMMNVDGKCNFSNAVFDDNVLFQLSRFNNSVQFNAAEFNQNANFTKVKFYDDVFFNYAKFYRTFDINSSVFRGRTEFIKTKFNMISEFKNCLFLADTKFEQSEISGILTFENSIFYISEPKNFNLKILKESDLILKNTVTLSKKH